MKVNPGFSSFSKMVIAGCALTFACSSARNDEQAGDSVAVATDTVQVRQAIAAPPTPALTYEDIKLDPSAEKWRDSLMKYFMPVEVAELNEGVVKLQSIRSAEDLAFYYQEVLNGKLVPLVSQKFSQSCDHGYVFSNERPDSWSTASQHWDWIGELLPGIGTDFVEVPADDAVAIKSHHSTLISLVPLRELAVKTPEPEDELFYDALIRLQDVDPGIQMEEEVLKRYNDLLDPIYNAEDGVTIGHVGDKLRLEMLRELSMAASARKYYDASFAMEIEDLLRFQAQYYYHRKDSVLSEIYGMIDMGTSSKTMSPSELRALNSALDEILSKDEEYFALSR